MNYLKSKTELSQSMYQEKFTKITNIDISSVVIQKMKELNSVDYKDMICKSTF